MEQLCSHWTDLHEILCLSIFRKSVEKIRVLLTGKKITGTFTITSQRILLGMRNVSGKNLQRKSEHTFYPQQLLSENHTVYVTTRENVVQPDVPPDNTTLRRKVALCMMGN
jgi:hypothetical protein